MATVRSFRESDADAWSRIAVSAYPNFFPWKSSSKMHEMLSKSAVESLTKPSGGTFHVAEECGELVGGSRHFDFEMNYRGERVPLSGLGFVAVHMAHRCQGVAREIVRHFLESSRERGFDVAGLYPFRSDFYHKLGFGAGAVFFEHRFPASRFSHVASRAKVELPAVPDMDAVLACYERIAAARHGLLFRSMEDLQRSVGGEGRRLAVALREGCVRGYCAFSISEVEGGTLLAQDLHVAEIFWEDADALAALCSFLRGMADQVRFVDLPVHDEDFHMVLADPTAEPSFGTRRLGYAVGRKTCGMMFRLIDMKRFFGKVAGKPIWGTGEGSVRFRVEDDFLPWNADALDLSFTNGCCTLGGRPAVEVRLAIQDFSSLVYGSVSLASLVRLGRAETLSGDALLPSVSRILAPDTRPACATLF